LFTHFAANAIFRADHRRLISGVQLQNFCWAKMDTYPASFAPVPVNDQFF